MHGCVLGVCWVCESAQKSRMEFESIGKPVGPVALDVAKAFWESSFVLRSSYAFLSGTTLVLLVLTGLGGLDVYK